MGLSIKVKIPCNQIGFPSNKGKKPTLPIESRRIAVRYDDIGITVLKPDIDHIAFGFSFKPELLKKYKSSQNIAAFEKNVSQTLFHAAKTNANGLSMVEGVPFLKKPWVNYNLNIRYRPNKSTEAIFIQASPKNPDSNLDFMRFVMNPSRYDKSDFKAFRVFVEELLVCPDACISYEDFLIWSQIYRADVAVDILGARPADLEITTLVSGKASPKKKHIYKSATGRAETIYPGAKKGKSSGSYIYDKRKEQEENGHQPLYGDFLHSRFECRISKTTFHKLANCTNRCGRVAVRALDPKLFAKEHYTRQLFIRYALERTLDKALAVIPPKYQPKFLKSYNGAMRDIWDAKHLWSFWKHTVKTSGFFAADK